MYLKILVHLLFKITRMFHYLRLSRSGKRMRMGCSPRSGAKPLFFQATSHQDLEEWEPPWSGVIRSLRKFYQEQCQNVDTGLSPNHQVFKEVVFKEVLQFIVNMCNTKYRIVQVSSLEP